MMGRLLKILLVGFVVGIGAAMWVGPGLLAWWNRPALPTPFRCDDSMLYAMRALVWLQLGAGVGVGLLAVLVALAFRRRPATPPTMTKDQG